MGIKWPLKFKILFNRYFANDAIKMLWCIPNLSMEFKVKNKMFNN